VSAEKYSTYLDDAALPYFFCPGCGHGQITDALNSALVKLQLDPHRVVIVTDIGCSGLTDRYFTTNAFHGLHGRSITYASGIKLANPDLKVIVLMGDGGCGIGGHHLINAARRNIGITVVVFNNLNYGMTGGQHSVATPPGGITGTTPFGQLERPMDICQTAAVNGAGLVIRTTSFDKTLPDLIAQAVEHDGFSILDVWELCTAYYAPHNRLSRKALEETLEALRFPSGILHQEVRPEYSRQYRQVSQAEFGKPVMQPQVLIQKFESGLDHDVHLVVAGAAGKKINTAASIFCRGAVLSGLSTEQRNDYPVTVKSGHSTSEVLLSPEGVSAQGRKSNNIYLILFEEGLANVRSKLGSLTYEDTVYLSGELPQVDTPARQIRLDLPKTGARQEARAMTALAYVLGDQNLFPLEALKVAASSLPSFVQENLQAVEAASRVTARS
jgi:2-oxoglutarate/2-oxoacid ferredoxin oxidoreductase subunit beta